MKWQYHMVQWKQSPWYGFILILSSHTFSLESTVLQKIAILSSLLADTKQKISYFLSNYFEAGSLFFFFCRIKVKPVAQLSCLP